MLAGTNLPRVKEYNEMVVLDVVRRQSPISRAAIAKSSGLTFQTVSNISQRLLDSGVLSEEDDVAPSNGGRRSRALSLNKDAAYAVGIHLTRSFLSVALTNLKCEVLAQEQVQVTAPNTPEVVLPKVKRMVEEVIQAAPHERLLGMGVGVPGPIDMETGNTLIHSPELPGWQDFPIRRELEQMLTLPVTVDNNVTAVAIGEKWNGVGRNVANFLLVYLGNGVGCGVVVNGQIYRGGHSNSGEIAHIQVNPDGPPCYCGSHGCLEVYVTPQGILREARKAVVERSHLASGAGLSLPDSVEEVLHSEDRLFVDVVHETSHRLGMIIRQVSNVLDPEVVVLAGPTVEMAGPLLKQAIQEAIGSQSTVERLRPRVELSGLGTDSGPVGAAASVFERMYSPAVGGRWA